MVTCAKAGDQPSRYSSPPRSSAFGPLFWLQMSLDSVAVLGPTAGPGDTTKLH